MAVCVAGQYEGGRLHGLGECTLTPHPPSTAPSFLSTSRDTNHPSRYGQSIVVDGFITANEKKADDASILATTKHVLHLRKPKDLGSVSIPWDHISTSKQKDPFLVELEKTFQRIIDKMVFTPASIQSGRVQVLLAIDRHMEERGATLHEGTRRYSTLAAPSAITISPVDNEFRSSIEGKENTVLRAV